MHKYMHLNPQHVFKNCLLPQNHGMNSLLLTSICLNRKHISTSNRCPLKPRGTNKTNVLKQMEVNGLRASYIPFRPIAPIPPIALSAKQQRRKLLKRHVVDTFLVREKKIRDISISELVRTPVRY